MRVGVLEGFGVQQHAAILSRSTMGAFASKTFLPSYSGRPSRMNAGLVHVAVVASRLYFRPVMKSSAPCDGRGVDDARAGVHGDVVGEHAEHIAVEERDGGSSTCSSLRPGKRAISCAPASPHFSMHRVGELRGDDVDLVRPSSSATYSSSG